MVSCEKCFKFHNPVTAEKCPVCRDYSFQESILCDLLRSVNDSNEVECSAFKPNLSVIGEAEQSFELIENDNESVKLSDRHKWLKAYAIQQWRSDSDQIFCELNYHVCLIAKNRRKIFEKMTDQISEISNIFSKAGELFKGKVNLLCLGTDHIHIHIDSPPDYSADEVVKKTMAFVEGSIKCEFSKLVGNRESLFEKAYFIESIG